MKPLNLTALQAYSGGDFDDCLGTVVGLAAASALYGGLAGAAFGLIVVFGGGLLYCEATEL